MLWTLRLNRHLRLRSLNRRHEVIKISAEKVLIEPGAIPRFGDYFGAGYLEKAVRSVREKELAREVFCAVKEEDVVSSDLREFHKVVVLDFSTPLGKVHDPATYSYGEGALNLKCSRGSQDVTRLDHIISPDEGGIIIEPAYGAFDDSPYDEFTPAQ